MSPPVRYAHNGDVALAYQVVGDGPIDIVVLSGFVSNVELQWESPAMAAMLNGLAEGHRLILTDRRGSGMSERYAPGFVPPIEALTDDLGVVMDAAGSERAVVLAFFEGGMVGQLFAAAHPSRLLGLVLVDAFAVSMASPETPWLPPAEAFDSIAMREAWGQQLDPDFAYAGEAEGRWLLRMQRTTAAPGARCAEIDQWRHTDMRALLSAIHVPTLLLQDLDGTYLSDPRNGSMLKAGIPNARLVEYHAGQQLWWYRPADTIVGEVRAFAAAVGDRDPSLDRVLATVLFTDIVDSTAQAALLGDRGWRTVRTRHDEIVRQQLARFRGTEVKTMGDGFLATFDGPARAVRCAQEISSGVQELDIEIRAGLHIGEVELDGDDVAGIAVAIGARVGAIAGPSEVLVSQTIKDLTAGAGITFADRGDHELKGVPGPWRLYAAS